MADVPAPPALVSPAAASPVAAVPTAFWPRFVLGWQAFDAALKDWRHTWVSAAPDGPLAPAALRPRDYQRPRPGTLRAVQFGLIQGATYWKHALMPTLALDQEVVGYVSMMNRKPNDDGDITMDVVPLPAYAPILVYEGRCRPRMPQAGAIRRTLNNAAGLALGRRCGAIHCEFKADALPGLQDFLLAVRTAVLAGQTPVVAVRGRWTFDPFHSGWVEIHPARQARLVSPSGEGYPAPLPLPSDAVGGADDDP